MGDFFDNLNRFLSGDFNTPNMVKHARIELAQGASLFHDSINGGEKREQFISLMAKAKKIGLFDSIDLDTIKVVPDDQRADVQEIFDDTEKYAHGYAALINQQGFWLRKYEIVDNEVTSIESSKVDLRYREALHRFGKLQEVIGLRAIQYKQGGGGNG